MIHPYIDSFKDAGARLYDLSGAKSTQKPTAPIWVQPCNGACDQSLRDKYLERFYKWTCFYCWFVSINVQKLQFSRKWNRLSLQHVAFCFILQSSDLHQITKFSLIHGTSPTMAIINSFITQIQKLSCFCFCYEILNIHFCQSSNRKWQKSL